MRSYEVFQKFASVADYRNNKPMKEGTFLGTFDTHLGLTACNFASQAHGVPSLLLSARRASLRPCVDEEEYCDQIDPLERPGY